MRKLIGFALAALLLSACAIPALADDYDGEEPTITVMPVARGALRIVEDFDREFNSPFDRFFFYEFGDGYELVKNNVTEINEIFYAGGFEIEIQSAIAIHDWVNSGPVGEMGYRRFVSVFILGTIIDPLHVLQTTLILGTYGDCDTLVMNRTRVRANVLHFDTETDTAYFVAIFTAITTYDAENVNTNFYISDYHITGTGSAVNIPIGFYFPGAYVPIFDIGRVSFEGVFNVYVQNRYFSLTEFEVNMRGISFRLLDSVPSSRYNTFTLFEIEYLFADGTVYRLYFSSVFVRAGNPYYDSISALIGFCGVFIDISELIGIRINGTPVMLT